MRVPIQVKIFSIWEFTMSVVKRTASFTFMQCGFLQSARLAAAISISYNGTREMGGAVWADLFFDHVCFCHVDGCHSDGYHGGDHYLCIDELYF